MGQLRSFRDDLDERSDDGRGRWTGVFKTRLDSNNVILKLGAAQRGWGRGINGKRKINEGNVNRNGPHHGHGGEGIVGAVLTIRVRVVISCVVYSVILYNLLQA